MVGGTRQYNKLLTQTYHFITYTCICITIIVIFVDREAREIMYFVVSIRQGRISRAKLLILRARLCRVQQRTKKSHYQLKMFVCVSNNRMHPVDWLLILYMSQVH